MEQVTDNQIASGKIYRKNAIWVGALLGGPLTAGYLIAENFKFFNQPDAARKTWIYAIISTAIIVGLILFLPIDTRIPTQLIPLTYTSIAAYLARHFQGEKIIAHTESGGQVHSWWRVIKISILGIWSLVIIAIILSLFIPE